MPLLLVSVVSEIGKQLVAPVEYLLKESVHISCSTYCNAA